MRQLAWLHTVPEKAKQPRYKTRVVSMPDVEGGEYLVNLTLEIGPSKVAGMGGLVGIDEIDIAAWQANHGISLTSWEAKTIRALSQAYAYGCMDSRDAKAPAPYSVPRDGISLEQKMKISDAMNSWADKLNNQKRRP